MSWTEIVIVIARQHAENLSDALMESGALSVSVEDADEGTSAEQPLFGEPGLEPEQAAWERSRVVALTPTDIDHAALLASAATRCGLDSAASQLDYSLRAVADQDWVRLTQSQFEPIHIGKNIWVVPSWHAAPDADALILELDPGLAFGTGSHPTTRLCMEWLEAQASAGGTPFAEAVLDYGCGSGILALVAKKLGATRVIGVDIDPQAIESARDNSARNHCAIDYYLPQEFSSAGDASYNIVVANILATPLMEMAAMLTSFIAPRGSLVLSGVLAEQADAVIAAYARFIRLTVWREQDGWVALSGTLTTSSSDHQPQ